MESDALFDAGLAWEEGPSLSEASNEKLRELMEAALLLKPELAWGDGPFTRESCNAKACCCRNAVLDVA